MGNLDGLIFTNDGQIIVQDTKLKFSQLKEPDQYPLEMHQFRAYCKMVKTNRALIVYGSITSKPPKLVVEARSFVFTQEEIDQTWQLIQATKNHLEKLKG